MKRILMLSAVMLSTLVTLSACSRETTDEAKTAAAPVANVSSTATPA